MLDEERHAGICSRVKKGNLESNLNEGWHLLSSFWHTTRYSQFWWLLRGFQHIKVQNWAQPYIFQTKVLTVRNLLSKHSFLAQLYLNIAVERMRHNICPSWSPRPTWSFCVCPSWVSLCFGWAKTFPFLSELSLWLLSGNTPCLPCMCCSLSRSYNWEWVALLGSLSSCSMEKASPSSKAKVLSLKAAREGSDSLSVPCAIHSKLFKIASEVEVRAVYPPKMLARKCLLNYQLMYGQKDNPHLLQDVYLCGPLNWRVFR